MEPNENEEEQIKVEPYHDEGPIVINPKIEMRGHQWVQQGYSIVCRSCSLRHAHFIGPDYILTGIDEEGLPTFSKRKFNK